jgi:hypothetical protein
MLGRRVPGHPRLLPAEGVEEHVGHHHVEDSVGNDGELGGPAKLREAEQTLRQGEVYEPDGHDECRHDRDKDWAAGPGPAPEC